MMLLTGVCEQADFMVVPVDLSREALETYAAVANLHFNR